MDEVENPALPAAGEASPTLKPNDAEAEALKPTFDPPDDAAAALGIAKNTGLASQPALPAPRALGRPGLKRESSVPAPQQPPPAPPSSTATIDFSQEAPDSLTLADLKRIRSQFPNATVQQKLEPFENERVYDFDYQDAQSFPVELEEWFSYSEEEENKLRRCKTVYNRAWRASEHGNQDWTDVTDESRQAFVETWIVALQTGGKEEQVVALMILTYIALGLWDETAGRAEDDVLEKLFPNSSFGGSRLREYGQSSVQIRWVVSMVNLLHLSGGVKVIYDCLRRVCDKEFLEAPVELQLPRNERLRPVVESIELWCSLTLMYLFVEVSRTAGDMQTLKSELLALEPNLLNQLTEMVARLRWDENAPIPLTKMLLLAWKCILISIGGIKDAEAVKASLREDKDEMDARGQPIITASPLDYHLFRQEISSKYPAYQPPPPLFPIESENNSILPPLKHRRPSYATSDIHSGAPAMVSGSIMHHPIHIATPAPSPPPSPGGPGKPGKKQNYQTNQMFPFIYPPLGIDSNDLGGKGSTELQDVLVGRKWEGSDIPTSILEAAELFAKRMRATRGMKQLWETRIDFMKQERGWKGPDASDSLPEVDDFELIPKLQPEESVEQGKPVPQSDEQRRLTKVSSYYRASLPHLQSVVIVLLKTILATVTDLAQKGNGPNTLQPPIQFNDANGVNGTKSVENGANHSSDGVESTVDEVDKIRSQEISAKALSAILLLLLKWFKVSHILQYEYMTQLLVDSNFVPLVLRIWQGQDIGRTCHYKLDREERNFFYFCQDDSRKGRPARFSRSAANNTNGAAAEDSSSEDDAVPPPIKLKRDDPADAILSPASEPANDFQHPPEVDELGYPLTRLPPSPLESYSWRNIFTAINYLRILQKVTRRKTHRSLLLVSYKSSNHLKKSLKIPIQLLRYYTLKLFKSQVPFCGRKWRQSNMKIITAVWLSVPAELRDDWLTGGGGGMGGAFVGDVDGTVEDALPLEQSLRALTHWWNVRNFPESMGVEKGMLDEEMDYFTRELEKMEIHGLEEELNEERHLEDEAWIGTVEGY